MSINFLDKIVKHKREEIDLARRRLPVQEIMDRLDNAPPVAGRFARALRRPGEVALIAEVKRGSPSRGVIRRDFNLEETVKAYRDAGADAISILTDSEFFGGSPEFLIAARKMTGQPLLRKDFILDPYQVYESRLLGADALLLIAGLLTGNVLGEFIALADSLGMDALVETRSLGEIRKALESGASIIGINNRDLQTFKVDLQTTGELIRHIDNPDITIVSESGVKTRADVQILGDYGADAVLVGETLMTFDNLRAGVRMLKGVMVEREAVGP